MLVGRSFVLLCPCAFLRSYIAITTTDPIYPSNIKFISCDVLASREVEQVLSNLVGWQEEEREK